MEHILAACFSDARLNIMVSLNDIREKSGFAHIDKEEHNVQSFKDLSLETISPDSRDKRIKLLRRRFPFIDTMVDHNSSKEEPAAKYHDLFCWLFQLVNELRNSFIHPTDQEMEIDDQLHKKISDALKEVYDCGLRTVQSRFQLDTNTIKPLLRCDENGTAKSFDKFSLALCTDYKEHPENENIKQSKILHDFGRILLCSLFLEKRQSAELISYFWKKKRAGHKWNDKQKKIIKELLGVNRIRLPLQRLRTDNTLTTVTLDTISELGRCPRPLFELLSANDQESFRVGTSPLQTTKNSDDDSSYLLLRGKQDRFIPLMMRHLDFDDKCRLRFAVDLGQYYYHVRLKPGDDFVDGNLRIRRLGQKIIAFGRLKDFEDAPKPQIWKDLEENSSKYANEEDFLKDVLKKGVIQPLKPYIVKTYPHYHLYKDKIGICIDWQNKKAEYPVPDIQDAGRQGTDSGKGKCQLAAPQFWISPNQMVDLAFYHYLQKSQKRYPEIEHLLKKYRCGMVTLIKNLKQGDLPTWKEKPQTAERRAECQCWINGIMKSDHFTIALADLPKVIRRYLEGSDSRATSASDISKRAKTMLEETCKKQEEIEYLLKRPKKRGKKGFRPIKNGNIADFLTEDLLRFQPKDSEKANGGKLTSQKYQILQKAIAYYGLYLDKPPRIVDLLKDAGLLKGEFKHPFLGRIITENDHHKYSTLIDFYQDYLKARKKFLENFIQPPLADSPVPGWLRLRTPSTLQRWLNEQIDENGKLCQPLPVPKSLFYQPLLEMTAKELDLESDELRNKGTQTFKREGQEVRIKPSVSWFIRQYMAKRGDSGQKMYTFKRRHELFDVFGDNRDMKKNKEKFKTRETYYLSEDDRQEKLESIGKAIENNLVGDKEEKYKKLCRAYKRSEKKIRHFSTMDMVLYLMAREKFKQLKLYEPNNEPDWSLQSLENTILSTKIEYALSVPDMDRVIVHEACAIKKTGELRLLVRDRRLPSLLCYYPKEEKEIDQAEIRAELADYSRKRVDAMELIANFERKIVEFCNPGVDKKVPAHLKDFFGLGKHGILLYALYQQFQKKQKKPGVIGLSQGFSKNCFNHARQIRNAFAHNQYPASEQFKQIVCQAHQTPKLNNPANHRKIAAQLIAELEKLYTPWHQFLN